MFELRAWTNCRTLNRSREVRGEACLEGKIELLLDILVDYSQRHQVGTIYIIALELKRELKTEKPKLESPCVWPSNGNGSDSLRVGRQELQGHILGLERWLVVCLLTQLPS